MIILQIWTELTCGRTLNSYLWKKTPPNHENQTIPVQCNSIDKILSERSANEIIVGCRSSLFRQEKAECAQRTPSSRSPACVGTMLRGGRGAGTGFGTGWAGSAIPHSIPSAWELPKAEQRELNPPKTHPGQ